MAPIIAGLEAYHHAHGRYPDSLTTLAPAFVPLATVEPLIATRPDPVEYHLGSVGYVLTFKYYRPGENECSYASEAAEWTCRGRF